MATWSCNQEGVRPWKTEGGKLSLNRVTERKHYVQCQGWTFAGVQFGKQQHKKVLLYIIIIIITAVVFL